LKATAGSPSRALGVILACVLLAAGVFAMPRSAGGAYPGANGKIAFETNRDGNLEIYSMNPDGSGQTNLTNDPAEDTDPVWSPDGTRIAFVKASEGHRNIYVMNADGSGQTNLTPGPVTTGQANEGTNPTWSPDGSPSRTPRRTATSGS
jgi:dipeptidyl aminopeptidase/acylaminoacyl peptidase